ncbi:hypothetical protein MKW94_000741 [Papaver nudicaule]|uniref:Pre-mRNA-splicing factor Syf1/CRNKL1-like C-terminal HAT-repeats domain-containing protein n=1 Tax=Papaver nudicaule TaxID=74823 RepID=A0AA41VWI9_PAPNU|nr:hypothetical protein [Papaver nudicaule]
MFKYPHVKDIWITYLSKFVERYGKDKLERTRELFEHALQMAPAKLEEDSGRVKRAMEIYEQAAKALPDKEKLQMYDIYITRATKFYGAPKTAIESDMPSEDVKTMCMKYADLEKSLGETDRTRAIYIFSSQYFADHCQTMISGEDGMILSCSMTRIILPNMDTLKGVGGSGDEMANLERQLAPAQDNSIKRLGFVNAGVEGVIRTDQDTIELPVGDDDDEISRKRENDGKLGRPIDRIKRQKKGAYGCTTKTVESLSPKSLIAV